MIRAAAFFGLLGLAAAIGLIVWQGYDQVLAAFAAAGWGIVWASLFHLGPMAMSVVGWRLLWPGQNRPTFGFMFLAQWIRASVNNLLPVARIGGEVAAARVMIKFGWRRAPVIAGLVVETTVSVATVFALVMTGIALLALRDTQADVMQRLVIGAIATTPVIVVLAVVQKIGFFRVLARLTRLLAGEKLQHIVAHSARLDRAISTMYRRHGRVLACGAWMMASWFAGAGGIWISLYFLGHPLSVVDCVIVEAMVQLASTAAFVVPAALGAQEGAFLFFGAMLGLPPDMALALALIRRCRDVIIYVPGLIVWQSIEGKWMMAKRRAKAA
ncbi:MAG: lysylphosphatidylglycerol synthase domain-containing protein [Alphaproteobacteria bacterium]